MVSFEGKNIISSIQNKEIIVLGLYVEKMKVWISLHSYLIYYYVNLRKVTVYIYYFWG